MRTRLALLLLALPLCASAETLYVIGGNAVGQNANPCIATVWTGDTVLMNTTDGAGRGAAGLALFAVFRARKVQRRRTALGELRHGESGSSEPQLRLDDLERRHAAGRRRVRAIHDLAVAAATAVT